MTLVQPRRLVPPSLLAGYVMAASVAGVTPVDRAAWALTSILPAAFVAGLAVAHRRLRLSTASYALIAAFLLLHTVGSHYTYAGVPVGRWLTDALALGRNPFDRVVHFAFGLLLTYPLLEVFARLVPGRPPLVYYLAAMTNVGLSGLWEVLEAWVAQLVSPELGAAYLGAQGDVWDAQHDMAAALLGTALCLLVTALGRRPRPPQEAPRTGSRTA
jgi:putative membrane protein